MTQKARARDLGLPMPGTCGPLNAITDVSGLEVGLVTLIEGEGPLEIGKGPVRTGVTAILPRGRDHIEKPVWASMFASNGNGEFTGSHWINEVGQFTGPVCITNTHSVGAVHEGVIRWTVPRLIEKGHPQPWLLPVIGETCDAHLNDINGLHVRPEHAMAALDACTSSPVAEGNTGGGTGMICHEFKGGTGTASRQVSLFGETFTLGALVQANHGLRDWLTIRGVPVGKHLTEHKIREREQGSIIVVLATDMPLLPIQLSRLAKRLTIGIGRSGTPSGNDSGDIFLALSTANNLPADEASQGFQNLRFPPNQSLDPVFMAAIEAVEEAIINALLAAETMEGHSGHSAHAIDHAALMDVMKRYGY